MILNNIKFDDPDPKNFPKKYYEERCEGKRTKIKCIWVDEYIPIDNGHIYASHEITLTNYGSVNIDDKPIRDPKEIEWVKNFFNELKI